MAKPTLAILTESIRYDNQNPLKYFSKIRPVHFYKIAPYGDLKKDELRGAIQYKNFADLEKKLIRLKPNIIQGAEPYGSKIQLRLCHVAWKVSRKLNIPLIFGMLENRPVEERFGKVLSPMLKKILKAYAKQASLIFYLNQGAKRNLLEVDADPSKMKKILYGIWGVDTVVFKPSASSRNGVLFAGRLDEAKGVPYLLAAWKMLRKDFPNLELTVAGKGEMEKRVKNKGKEGIRYLGMVKNQDLPKVFNQALFTVYPSVTLKRWEEQVGTVNLQSLACGTPVITTKSGAIPEYINSQVGILVPERNPGALAVAMKRLLSDKKLRRKLGDAGRKYILKNFDAKKTIVQTEEILLKKLI